MLLLSDKDKNLLKKKQMQKALREKLNLKK